VDLALNFAPGPFRPSPSGVTHARAPPPQSMNRYLISVQSAGKPSFQVIFFPSE
jgi:hypothetical protein